MRIRIICDAGKGIKIPLNYNYYLASVIYSFLEMSDPKYAYFLHTDGYQLGDKHFKLFTFSQLLARHDIEGDYIKFSSTVNWYVSSPQETFLANFASSLLEKREILIYNNRLLVKDVEIPQVPTFKEVMKFRCLSPITISTKRERNGRLITHYCLPTEPEFSELIRQNLIRKHELIYNQKPFDDSFTMSFDEEYTKKRCGRITKLIRYKDINIRGVLCPFLATGSKELMCVGYECGFGDKNSAGFGMVDVC
ncbi:MAG: CRISPR-associated endoribonuclease Cas6 [bacterium]